MFAMSPAPSGQPPAAAAAAPGQRDSAAAAAGPRLETVADGGESTPPLPSTLPPAAVPEAVAAAAAAEPAAAAAAVAAAELAEGPARGAAPATTSFTDLRTSPFGAGSPFDLPSFTSPPFAAPGGPLAAAGVQPASQGAAGPEAAQPAPGAAEPPGSTPAASGGAASAEEQQPTASSSGSGAARQGQVTQLRDAATGNFFAGKLAPRPPLPPKKVGGAPGQATGKRGCRKALLRCVAALWAPASAPAVASGQESGAAPVVLPGWRAGWRAFQASRPRAHAHACSKQHPLCKRRGRTNLKTVAVFPPAGAWAWGEEEGPGDHPARPGLHPHAHGPGRHHVSAGGSVERLPKAVTYLLASSACAVCLQGGLQWPPARMPLLLVVAINSARVLTPAARACTARPRPASPCRRSLPDDFPPIQTITFIAGEVVAAYKSGYTPLCLYIESGEWGAGLRMCAGGGALVGVCGG